MATTLKTCSRCGEEKTANEFGSNRGHRDGLSTYCLPCKASDERERRLANPERHAEYRRIADKKYRYGLSRDEYESLVRISGGRCAICGQIPDRTLHVDHDHETGRVRGLLCDRCNRGIGYFADDAERLRRAATYLENA